MADFHFRNKFPRMSKGGLLLLSAAAFWVMTAELAINAATNVSHKFVPVRRDFSDDLLPNLKAPAGFKINVFARAQGNARMMLLLPNGTILLTRFDIGELVALRDLDGDGVADESPVVANIPTVHGLALRDNKVYLASETKLFTMTLGGDGSLGMPNEFAQLP